MTAKQGEYLKILKEFIETHSNSKEEKDKILKSLLELSKTIVADRKKVEKIEHFEAENLQLKLNTLSFAELKAELGTFENIGAEIGVAVLKEKHEKDKAKDPDSNYFHKIVAECLKDGDDKYIKNMMDIGFSKNESMELGSQYKSDISPANEVIGKFNLISLQNNKDIQRYGFELSSKWEKIEKYDDDNPAYWLIHKVYKKSNEEVKDKDKHYALPNPEIITPINYNSIYKEFYNITNVISAGDKSHYLALKKPCLVDTTTMKVTKGIGEIK